MGSRLLVLWAGLLAGGDAVADEWSTRANIYQLFGYEDNVCMRQENLGCDNKPGGVRGSFQYRIIPTLNFVHRTDVSEVNAHVSYGTQVFTDIPRFNQDIQSYGLDATYNTERIKWGMDFKYAITPTRNQAIQDSGNFTNNAENASWSISPMMSVALTPIDNLILSPSYGESSFSVQQSSNGATDTNDTPLFRNNVRKGVSLGWQRNWSQLYSSNVDFSYSNFEFDFPARDNNPGLSRSNDSYSFNLANHYQWSQNWDLNGSVGVRYVETSPYLSTPGSSSTGFLANLGANYSGENYEAGISFSRSLSPSNFGQLQELTGTTLHFNYKIDERLSAGLNMSYQDSSLVNATAPIDRENIVVHPSVNWLLDKDWSLNASYRFRTQERVNTLNAGNANSGTFSAESNFFMFSVNYKWPGLKLSR